MTRVVSKALATPLGRRRLSIQRFKDVEAFEEAPIGPVKVAGAVLAVVVLGFEGAVAGDVLWGIAFPAESRRGNAMIVM